jgi:type VI secretion system protein ImpH
MAAESRHAEASLITRLFGEAHRFEFFQAVRLLQWVYRERGGTDPAALRRPVGQDGPPQREVVRFKALPSLSFPPSAIGDLREAPPEISSQAPSQMRVALMGLTGPQGVLPQHYTELLVRRIRAKDFALRDFLDLFNHRSISLFYRAWEKYRVPLAFERARVDHDSVDSFTECLRCVIGLGTRSLRERLMVRDDVLLFYAGHYSHRPRSAIALQCLLAEYLQLPVEVEQFQGQWLSLSEDERTRLPGPSRPGQYHQLGIDAVVGERVWDIQSQFRLRVGPVDYAQFRRLMPGGDSLLSLGQLTRTYVGPELAFDVQPILRADQVPRCCLGGHPATGARLGWNTWLYHRPFTHDADDAVFHLDD